MKKHLGLSCMLVFYFVNNLVAQVSLVKPSDKYHHGIGFYPIANYEFGRNLKLNYILSKRNHSFYLGFSTHINNNIDLPSQNQNTFRDNGVAKKAIHFFHPNMGYTKFIILKKNFPVSLFFNFDFQFGKIYLNGNSYYYSPEYSIGAGLEGEGYRRYLDENEGLYENDRFHYWQFTTNIGLKVDITPKIRVVSSVGAGIVSLNSPAYRYESSFGFREFPRVYSVGVNYIF